MVEYKDVLGFEQEPLESADFASLKEAVEEARRCLNCAVPQCRKGCPINNEIPQFIHALAQGNIGEAAEHIAHNSCLPGICGRVCPWEKQCEGACVLGKKGKHVEIGKLERFVADKCFEGGLLPLPKKGDAVAKVAVIGSGPAGLAAAHELLSRQYDVTIFESASEPGGMLMFGIPSFRLHKKHVYREMEYLQQLGAVFQFNTKIGADKQISDLFAEGYEAVFIATGAPVGWNLGVENDTVDGVVDAQHRAPDFGAESLNAEREAVYAARDRRFNARVVKVVNAAFERNFAVVRERQVLLHSLEHAAKIFGRKRRGRAAAEVDGVNGARSLRSTLGVQRKFLHERIRIRVRGRRIERILIEHAVKAARLAKGYV